jgi:predicted ferric reductase
MTPENEPMRLPTGPAGSQETAARLGQGAYPEGWASDPTASQPYVADRYAQPTAEPYAQQAADYYAQPAGNEGYAPSAYDGYAQPGTNDRYAQAGANDGYSQPGSDRYSQRPSQSGKRHRPPDLTPRERGGVERSGGSAYGNVGRWVLVPLFWVGLLFSVGTVFFNTPVTTLTNAGAVLTALGRATGMAGGYLLLMQILLKSRVAWLEMSISTRRLLRWHRRMGPYLLVVLIAHMVLITVGLAQTDGRSIAQQTVTLLTTWEDMVTAFVAIGVLSVVAMLGIRAIRRWMPYELWRLLHSAGYLVLLLAYGHQFANGIELQNGGPIWWYWSGLYAFVVAGLIWGRVVEPLWLNMRYRLRVTAVVPESRDSFSVYIGGRRLEDLDGKPGQFYRWRFLGRKLWWQSHPFSLSAAPNRKGVRLTVKAVGDFTRALGSLRPGTRVIAEGPYGDFTADKQVSPGVLLIAAGSGIAPIRALAEDMPPGTILIYRVSSADELVFRKELDALTRQRGIRIQVVIGSRRDPGPRRLASPAGLLELVPDIGHRDVYLCGPEGLISTMVDALDELGVPPAQIHLDPFEF